MPVKFDEYEAAGIETGWPFDPDSNASRVLAFLAEHPDTGFTPSEIHEATDIPRGSVGTTLYRLEEKDLVRHKEPYWAIDPRGIEVAEALRRSLRHVEETTDYDWGDADPASYRIGLDAVRMDRQDGA